MKKEGIYFIVMPIFFTACFFILAMAMPFTVQAADTLISQDTVWDKGEVKVIEENTNLIIMPGAKLTINPGVIIKLGLYSNIVDNGNLIVQGNAEEPVIFTSLQDDSAGGDTNNNGYVYLPEAGDWKSIIVGDTNNQASLYMDYAVIKYGYTGIDANNADDFRVLHSTINNNYHSGIELDSANTAQINFSNIYENYAPYVLCMARDGYTTDIGLIYKGFSYMDATNNYWGHPDGPTTLSTEGITGAYITGRVFYQPFLSNKWQGEKKNNPVIIVPGILGSYLVRENTYEEIWPRISTMFLDPWDGFLNELALRSDGTPDPNASKLYPSDIFRKFYGEDFFGGLIDELKQEGYVEGVDLFIFPYDWRLNIETSSLDLKNKITEIKAQTDSSKINIIAHSMGGMVVKEYLHIYGGGAIDKFIDIATPHLGSPSIGKNLMFGDNLDIWFLNSNVVKSISQNFLSAYQLLPSKNYFNINNSDYSNYISDLYDYDQNGVTGNLNFYQSKDFLKNTGRNEILLNLAENFQNNLDNFNPVDYGVDAYNIVGCGRPTIGRIYVLNKEKNGYEYGLKYINGDGSVPLESAKYLPAIKTYFMSGIDHAYLPSINGVKQLASTILEDKESSFDFSPYPDLGQSQGNCQLNGLQISFHSPIDLHVYDENNNHVGPNENGDIETGIAGTAYDIIEGNKFVFLPLGHNYRVVGEATAPGTFNARIQSIENGITTQTTYYNELPLATADAKIELNLDDNQIDGSIKIDENGDNIFEQISEPSSILNQEESADLIKPETDINIKGSMGENNWYISKVKISLTASDNNNGSGILKTEYSLDNGNNWQTYIRPFTLNQDEIYNIVYSSTDRAGNKEVNKRMEVRIDKTKPEAFFLLPNEISHNEKINIEYIADDNLSGIATDTLAIYFDNKLMSTTTVDLFYQNLGEHKIKIKFQDLAGNRAIEETTFNITVDINGVMADVNRAYDENMINEKAKNYLVKDLSKISGYIEKYGNRVKNKNKKMEELMNRCINKKGEKWCERKLGRYFNKINYQLEAIYERYLKAQLKIILNELNLYYKNNWVTKVGYDIIKEDLKYLINF